MKARAPRCCASCKHCEIDILRGYECMANKNIIVQLDKSELLKDRSKCKAYVRG